MSTVLVFVVGKQSGLSPLRLSLLRTNLISLTGELGVFQRFKAFNTLRDARIMQIYAIPVEHMLKLPGCGE